MTKTNSKKIASGVAGLLTAVCMACPALAATLPVTLIDPAGGAANVAASGSVTSTTVGNTQTYNQTSATAIVEHSSYNVSWNGTVNYTNSSSATVMKTLARIYDKNPSQIFGTINDPHGILILANQNGIHFGNGSHVNVGGLIATTSAISNGDFDVGTYNFTAGSNPNAAVINDGTIKTKLTTVDNAGLVAFLAPTVKNNGYIEAKAGTVVLAGGDTATFVDLYGDGLINLATNGEVEHLLINNKGTINANGGDVRLTAGTAKTVVDSLINMDGVILADKVDDKGGKVTLEANAVEMEGGCFLPATIIADGGNVKVTGFGATNLDHTAGVLMDNALIYAGNGKVSVWGKGYEGVKDDAATHNTGNNYGVVMKNGSKIMTDGVDSKIFITGFGGNGYGLNDGKVNQSTNDNHGVYITGEDTRVTSQGGDINIFGQGGGKTATFGSSNDYGVFIEDGAKVASFDKAVYPEVDAKETMLRTRPEPTFVGGDVTIVGFGGGTCQWCGYDYGVYIKGDVETKRTRHGTETKIEVSSVTSESGDINIWGVGGGGDVGSYGNFGVFVDEYGNVGSKSGDIGIFGVGGKGDSTTIYNYGVLLNNHASVTNHRGDITITGLGGGDQTAANNNYGIVMYDESFVGGKNFNGDYDGGPVIMSYVGGGGDVGGHDHGDIRFITDTILFDDTVRVKTTGDVYFEPFHNWTTIGIAGGTGTLQLTKTVLDDVYAGTITIGNTYRDWGKITANAYDWRMPVSILNGGSPFFSIYSPYGDIQIDGLQTINGENTFYGHDNNTFRAVTAWGDIIIGEEGGVISLGGGGEPAFRIISEAEGCECGPDRETLITLAASFGRFINEAGPGALDAGNGRWVVYSFGPYDDVFGGLNSDNEAVWGRVYNKYHPLSDSWYPGNRYVFTVKPILTVTFDPMTKLFGTDATAAVAADTFSVDYTVRDLFFDEHPLLPTITDAFLFSPDTFTVEDIASAGSPPPASVGDYDILAGYVGDAYGSHVRQVPGTLTVYALPLNGVLDRSKAPGRRGPSGTLLSIVNNPLADLAPAAGGAPTNLADLSPKAGGDLANLSPQAGAGGGASITPLIQCNEVTPCDINQ